MIINEKIIRELRNNDLTISIRAVKEIPDGIRISIRNDEYVASHIVFRDIYINDSTAPLEFLINNFKEGLVNQGGGKNE